MLESLKKHLEEIGPVNDELWKEILVHSQIKKIDKNEILIAYGSHFRNMYFVLSGALMTSICMNDGKSKAVWFSFENHFNIVSSYDSFFLNEPTKYEIIALENTVLFEMSKEKIDHLRVKYPLLSLRMLEDLSINFAELNDIRNYSLAQPPIEFAIYIKKKYPFIFKRVPSKYIAEFLGITPEWYCKLQKKILN